VFARSFIPAGTQLAVFGGYVMRIADEPSFEEGGDFALQIDDEFVIGARSDADMDDAQYFNHSCDPNAGLRGQLGLVAMRDIATDEEVTFDYAMVLVEAPDQPTYEFECHCGSADCRGRVSNHDWRLSALQERYRGWFSWCVQEHINRDNGASDLGYHQGITR
jgi:SET domain-containing protein